MDEPKAEEKPVPLSVVVDVIRAQHDLCYLLNTVKFAHEVCFEVNFGGETCAKLGVEYTVRARIRHGSEVIHYGEIKTSPEAALSSLCSIFAGTADGLVEKTQKAAEMARERRAALDESLAGLLKS
jgi:hypothetical protein